MTETEKVVTPDSSESPTEQRSADRDDPPKSLNFVTGVSLCFFFMHYCVVPNASVVKMLIAALPVMMGMYMSQVWTALGAAAAVALDISYYCTYNECHFNVPDLADKERMNLMTAGAFFILGTFLHLRKRKAKSLLKQD
ncbi:Hypothetical predicted protein [Cloeon dipterum]|uniref:Uncharacterized protein n=1 Tax=Cloeon dipterum TaxID=197152 RepID=A0A8S1E070_9INSE|nr:Hypothetical predicted protein [Cloeon dipterum]